MPPHGHRHHDGPLDEPPKTKKELVRASLRLMKYVLPYWHFVAALLVISALTTGASLARPWLFGILIDKGIIAQEVRILYTVTMVVIGLSVAALVLGFIHSYVGHWVGQRIVYRLRTDLYDHLQSLSVGFFERKPTGEVMSRVVNDTEAVESLIVHAAERLLMAIATLGGIATFMFMTNASLASVAVIPIR